MPRWPPRRFIMAPARGAFPLRASRSTWGGLARSTSARGPRGPASDRLLRILRRLAFLPDRRSAFRSPFIFFRIFLNSCLSITPSPLASHFANPDPSPANGAGSTSTADACRAIERTAAIPNNFRIFRFIDLLLLIEPFGWPVRRFTLGYAPTRPEKRTMGEVIAR